MRAAIIYEKRAAETFTNSMFHGALMTPWICIYALRGGTRARVVHRGRVYRVSSIVQPATRTMVNDKGEKIEWKLFGPGKRWRSPRQRDNERRPFLSLSLSLSLTLSLSVWCIHSSWEKANKIKYSPVDRPLCAMKNCMQIAWRFVTFHVDE